MFDPLKSKAKVIGYTSVAFIVGIGVASGAGWTTTSLAEPIVSDQPQLTEASVQPAIDLSEAFVNIADVVTPAVVRIENRRQAIQPANNGAGDPLRRFFDLDPDSPVPGQPRNSSGSGFIVSEDGYILTNNHVVQGANELTVELENGREYPARVIGADPTTDVALIKIEGNGFPTLSFGDSEGVKVGEWILAIGNPGFGGGSQLNYTVTAGIVSAKGRSLQLIDRELRGNPNFDPANAGFAIEDFIQTDAVINPGNSGGPMVNLRGQVVGINSAIASQTGFYQGYGFAIPIDLARRVMDDLAEYGRVRRAYLGVNMRDVDAVDAEYYGLPTVGGALISGITDATPAEAAGFEINDVIVGVDGVEISGGSQLQHRIALKRPGDQVVMTVVRDSEERDIRVVLGEAPFSVDTEVPTTSMASADEPETAETLGIQVQDLTPELSERYGYSSPNGVIISQINPSGAVYEEGLLSPGLRIVAINGEEIEKSDDVARVLDVAQSGSVVNFVLADPQGGTLVLNVRHP